MFTVLQYPLGVLRWTHPAEPWRSRVLKHRSFPVVKFRTIRLRRMIFGRSPSEILLLGFSPLPAKLCRTVVFLTAIMLVLQLGRGEAGKLNTVPSTIVVAEPLGPVPPDTRADDLRAFLESYDSPLAPHAEHFVAVADEYSLDWRLLPAIAGAESTFGKRVPYKSYNPFGWGNGRIYFSSWEEGIEVVARTLYIKYSHSGQRNLDLHQLGDIYAESPRWPKSVDFFMQKLEQGPAKLLARR